MMGLDGGNVEAHFAIMVSVEEQMKGADVSTQWELKNADVSLGMLTLVVIDQPWFRCEFTPTDEWEEVRQLFDSQAAAVDSGNEAQMMEAIAAVRNLPLKLCPIQDGVTITPVMIQIRSNKANFRY
ncbi:hypothetical protein ACFWC5_05970 [Streptomyces sp. NPDC060085]|uniref:hypothetical protein n=1 Tax=Streptomyces sp. NPDC060085 TaxID=3347054 RepID=UPI00365E7DC6